MNLTEAADVFAALSQDSRLKVLRDLVAAGPAGRTSGELSERLTVPASTLSFHLTALERAGLVRSTRYGRRIVHVVRFAAVRDLIGFLAETCCGGRPELCAELARMLPGDIDAPAMAASFNVLFLCTRNSARSIMAEAILNHVGAGRFHAYSAGSDPAAKPLPEVISTLERRGHDVSKLGSKSWSEFFRPDAPRMDFVIALCDTLEGQPCPDFGEAALTASWPLPDPQILSGNPVQRSLLLNEIYGGLRRRIESFVSLPFPQLDRVAVQRRVDEIATGGLVHAGEGRGYSGKNVLL